MAKAEKPKKTTKPSKKDQYERFQQTARDLGVDDEESAEAFERAFRKIVPQKTKRIRP
ncbi:MAG TPA: hypothetical protein VKW08_08965 [Xanthobacteraceae bacterium]|jgi:hypothetical protein|nr:hypothetical protein [Xanthobacteraceae bacterium]